MKKFLSLIPLVLLLAACNESKPELIRTQWKVVIPDASMYRCPSLKDYPNTATLTDIQVAKLIVELYKNNQTCKNSIDSIKTYLNEAQKQLESGHSIY